MRPRRGRAEAGVHRRWVRAPVLASRADRLPAPSDAPRARRLAALAAGALLAAAAGPAAAGELALIVDDLGNDRAAGLRAAALPGPVACAILPHTPHARLIARAARAHGKEVLLHLPMAAVDARPPGPGAIGLHMTRAELERTLAAALASVPGAVGVNNHMGSLITRHPGHMAWLMAALARRGLFFVDSRTTAATVAERLAAEHGVPHARRHVFLDAEPGAAGLRAGLARLRARLARRGRAVAIVHPSPAALALLERELPRLAREHRLVPVSALVERSGRGGARLAVRAPSRIAPAP